MAKFIRVTNIAQGIDMDTILNVDDIGHISIGPNIIFVKTPFADGTNRKNDLNDDIWAYLTSWADTKWDEFKYWMYHTGRNKAITTLANMHQFGYEVEKEPKYEVRIKGIDYKYCVLKNGDYWYFGEDWVDKKIKTQSFTRKELEEAGFGWVFDCPGVEVKEVDDGND